MKCQKPSHQGAAVSCFFVTSEERVLVTAEPVAGQAAWVSGETGGPPLAAAPDTHLGFLTGFSLLGPHLLVCFPACSRVLETRVPSPSLPVLGEEAGHSHEHSRLQLTGTFSGPDVCSGKGRRGSRARPEMGCAVRP